MKKEVNELILLKKIIDNYFGIDISDNNRAFDYVKGRCIFYHILCNDSNGKYTITEVSNFLKRSHATLIHALKNTFPQLMQNRQFQNDLFEIMNLWSKVEFELSANDNPCMSISRHNFIVGKLKTDHEIELSKLRSVLSDDLIKDISRLSKDQYDQFKVRATAIISNIKKMRTYENTNKSSFNPK